MFHKWHSVCNTKTDKIKWTLHSLNEFGGESEKREQCQVIGSKPYIDITTELKEYIYNKKVEWSIN